MGTRLGFDLPKGCFNVGLTHPLYIFECLINNLLEEKGRLATSPNGNGGWFTSMVKAGLDKDLHQKNIKWINIFAVDNVLQRIADPVFVGATILGKYQSASKVVEK
ncbi:MAG: UTP--glucose-1-phosphate uridylyltransferase [Treponema sp.]|nr:UTP--glucose-1-phosphate uridylyltransferase [Treponema sp.]